MSIDIQLNIEIITKLDKIIDQYEGDTGLLSDRTSMVTAMINRKYWEINE